MKKLALALIIALAAALPSLANQDLRKQLPPEGLSAKAHEMQTMILLATRAGDLNALVEAIQWNELPPSFAETKIPDPVTHFKKQSVDGQGFEMMAILRAILESAHAIRKAPNGKPDFIWPAAAEKPWSKLSPAEKVDTLRVLPRKDAKAFIAGGLYTYYSVMIGHDGTWHAFERN